jgi:hypothetical protein
VVAQKTTGSGAFSEIGFYNKKAKWPDAAKNADNIAGRLPENSFSRVDVLNIQSTGDIETRAENYHLLNAKRIEVLSNADEVSPETRADNCRNDYSTWTGDKAPLIDAPLDDSAVHEGDMHFRAGKNVIIKAVGEIRLQVGRTTLVINDDGFSAVTRKVNSNIPVPSDTSFNLKARDGISMFGESVTIASARKFGFSDAWGASVGSMVGRLNIAGQQINQKTYDSTQQRWAALLSSVTLAQNATIGGMATNPALSAEAGWTSYGIDVARFLTECVRDIRGIIKSYETYEGNVKKLHAQRVAKIKEAHDNAAQAFIQDQSEDNKVFLNKAINWLSAESRMGGTGRETIATNALDAVSAMVGAEPIEMLMACLDLVLAISAGVYTTVEQAAALQQRQDLYASTFKGEAKSWSAQDKSALKDTLNLCAMSIDGGIIEAAMLVSVGTGFGGPASIQLRQAGDIVIKAGKKKGLYAELKQDAAVPGAVFTRMATTNIRSAAAVTELLAGGVKLGLKTEDFHNRFPAYLERL